MSYNITITNLDIIEPHYDFYNEPLENNDDWFIIQSRADLYHVYQPSGTCNFVSATANFTSSIDPSEYKSYYELILPSSFWFNQNTKLTLPVIYMNYDNINVNLQLDPD